MNKNALTKANITTLHFLLYVLARAERPSARTLCEISGLSRVTIYRYFETLESMYGRQVSSDRDGPSRPHGLLRARELGNPQ